LAQHAFAASLLSLLLVSPLIFSAAVKSTEGEAATMIILICAGWIPHEHDPSGAASV